MGDKKKKRKKLPLLTEEQQREFRSELAKLDMSQKRFVAENKLDWSAFAATVSGYRANRESIRAILKFLEERREAARI